MVTAYTYDGLNRLTQMGTAKNAVALSNYAYTLGAAGNRLTVTELGGRTVNYGYDSLYRLTSETVVGDPANHNSTTQYTYDAVGNRQQIIVNGVTENTDTYDADDPHQLGKSSFLCRATKRGFERRSSSSGSTFRNTNPFERSA